MDVAITLVVLGLLAWAVLVFNRLIRARNRVRAAWSDIDVQLKRRHDLIPPLVEIVKGYVAHERGALEDVVRLRETGSKLTRPAQRAAVEQALGGRVLDVFALAEAYPDLKASKAFARLQRDLSEVEDDIQHARRYYNGAVRALNTRIESVPDLLIARAFGFRQAEFFEIEAASQRRAPEVALS